MSLNLQILIGQDQQIVLTRRHHKLDLTLLKVIQMNQKLQEKNEARIDLLKHSPWEYS